MSYARSDARKAFDCKILSLKRTARTASYNINSVPNSVRDLTYHAAIFEASACLEEYIRTLIDGVEYLLKSNSKAVDHLPKELRTFLFINNIKVKFKNYYLSEDEGRALRELQIRKPLYNILHDEQVVDSTLRIDSVYTNKKYPSVNNWRLLFKRLGISDIYGSVSSILSRDSEAILDSFNDVRTAIAHQIPPSLTINDVIRHLDNLIVFIRATDRVVYRHLVRDVGSECWPDGSS